MKKLNKLLHILITVGLSVFSLSSALLPYFTYYDKKDDATYIWSLREEIFLYSDEFGFLGLISVLSLLLSIFAIILIWLPKKEDGLRSAKSAAKLSLAAAIVANFANFCVWFTFELATDIECLWAFWISVVFAAVTLPAVITLLINLSDRNKIKLRPLRGEKFSLYDVLVLTIISIIALAMAYPFYNAVVISLMSQQEYIFDKFAFWPSNPTLDSYITILFDASGWLATGYKNTAIIVACTVGYSLVITTPCSYALSKRRFPGKMIFLNYIIFTMFFTGGMVPYYILIKQMNLVGSLWSLILPAGFTPFYMLLMRNFFMNIPNSIEESARLDGAGDWRILFSIILPVSKPVIASVALFKAVDMWNEWFYAMLFLGRDPDKFPLQYALRSKLLIATSINRPGDATGGVYIESVKMAAVVITMLPIMLLYPLIQKYFVSGIMTGAIKE